MCAKRVVATKISPVINKTFDKKCEILELIRHFQGRKVIS